ncbi:hypothetical protein BKA62DRAFT_689307 [Auriculariales sp. MPI-PUGE-AT-0066]|nr:hypothetical protein BKA62DRAFT_689307 [Auriculariales sp. MPI-PUGE-AT-0066]
MQHVHWFRCIGSQLSRRPFACVPVPSCTPFSIQSRFAHLFRTSWNDRRPATLLSPVPPRPKDYARRSRRVAQSIRQQLAFGNMSSALDITNAAIIADPATPKTTADVFTSVKIEFTLSSRLPLHAMAHGFLRAGKPFAAAEYIHARMMDGHKVKLGTLNALIGALCAVGVTPSADEQPSVFGPSRYARDIQQLEARHPGLTPGTRAAVQVLRCARKTKNHRDNRMYRRLIDACLLQGEIVVAALLFALLVRDWQLRRALTTAKRHDAAPRGDAVVDGEPLTPGHIQAARSLRLDDWSLHIPKPTSCMLQSILQHVSFPGMERNGAYRGAVKDPTWNQIYQMKTAMYHLAGLLHYRQLELDQMSTLISCLAHVPREPKVWVTEVVNGQKQSDEVYHFVHQVLMNFSQRLPVKFNQLSPNTPSMIVPPNIRTYNTLLDYILKHRMDLEAASRLLTHMRQPRHKPIYPDMTTYNIILRRASLLRRNDVVHRLLQQLREAGPKDPALLLMLDSYPRLDKDSRPDNPWKNRGESLPDHSFGSAIEKLGTRDLKLFKLEDVKEALAQLVADKYTLSGFITHLGSTGQSERVIELLYMLFPELQKQPSGDQLRYRPVRQRLRDAATRGARMGPYFFSTVIAVLRRCGKTGLAERVWFLGQVSEEASWMPDHAINGGSTPWTLDISAYTAMLQCYTREAKSGLSVASRNKNFVVGWGFFNWLQGTNLDGDFHARRQRQRAETAQRSVSGREIGQMLIASMRARAHLVWRVFTQARAGLDSEQPHMPRPDARFYNVLLDMFDRIPRMARRRNRSSRSRWQKNYDRALQRRNLGTWTPPPRDPFLLEIAQEMAKDGFSLPISLRRGLLDVRIPVANVQRLERGQPYRFPVQRHDARWLAHSLPIAKRKGLPISTSYGTGHNARKEKQRAWNSRFVAPQREPRTPDPAEGQRKESFA